MEKKVVKTINGAKHPEKDCRLIDGCYYLIGDNKIEDSGDVYLINNRYIRASTGRVVFDHFDQEYKLKNASLYEGIIGVDGEELELGYFTRNELYNVKVVMKDMSERIAISANVLNYAFREKKSDGVFYHISLLDATKFNALRGVTREIKESLPYDSKNSIAKALKNYENNYNPVICKDAQAVGEALGKYTFGLEFETCVGIVPNSKLNYLPLIPLRDGSIDGLEYATVPLQGPKGVQAIIDSADELKRRTDFNEGCSLHLHIGGMPRNVEFILAFYKLMSYFQNEIFSMFPLYKKYNFGLKRKNYSAPFPFEEINFKMDPSININDKKQLIKNFEPLFVYLSGGHSFADYNNDLNSIQNHPQDPQGNQKWNIKHRYSFINFIPLIFGNHQTIEFRIHTPTYNANKIIDFLMLNTFLINYASINYRNILNGTDGILRRPNLHTFIEVYVPNFVVAGQKTIYNELIQYVSDRRMATENLTREGGITYEEKSVRSPRQLRLNTYQFKKKGTWISEESFGLGLGGGLYDELNAIAADRIRRQAEDIRRRMAEPAAPVQRERWSPPPAGRKERRKGKQVPPPKGMAEPAPIAKEVGAQPGISFRDWWTDPNWITTSPGSSTTAGIAHDNLIIGIDPNGTPIKAAYPQQDINPVAGEITLGELLQDGAELSKKPSNESNLL